MTSNHPITVGIDLGTTHCALCTADPNGDSSAAFGVPQLVSRGTLESPSLLPSFLYFAHQSEGALPLPWDESRPFAVGEYARARATEAPGRVISSAKSWLSQANVDRRAPLLPLTAVEDITKISPVEVSRRYLEHLAQAWQHSAHGKQWGTLADHDVVLTVPASFDAIARELTSEAARQAGITQLTLLEEPQAALYAWIAAAGENWRQSLAPGDVILVVDIGGGTTDFSAIEVRENDGNLELVRVAVGDHILLGGDNMDLALAYTVRAKLGDAGKKLDAYQMASLTYACRSAKEKLLSAHPPDAVPISIASKGANLFAKAIRSELTASEVHEVLLNGFFPVVAGTERPLNRARSGLSKVGLDYASDAAVTKHLAAFLGRQAGATQNNTGSLLRVNKVLFNGGVLKAHAIRTRIVDTLNQWLTADGAAQATVLPGDDPDLAVARGAAYFGQVRRGKGLRIRGGTARAYYVGVESPMPAVPGFEPPMEALCVAPFGMEEGSQHELSNEELLVRVGEPVRFRFFGSSTRREDDVGVHLENVEVSVDDGELAELPPIELTLAAAERMSGDVVPVYLRSSITEVGTLLLEAIPFAAAKEGERWKVEFGVREE
jgi:molecular chaperone DnaK (HSP70)